MKTLYWLPCPCGQKHPVETTQAGDTVQCSCGTTLKVPALREMSQLESAVTTKPGRTRQTKTVWGKHQTRLLVGAFITVAAVAALVYVELSRPRLANVESLAPIQVWTLWQDMRRGPDRHLAPAEQRIIDNLGMYRIKRVALLVCAAAGLLWMAASYAIPVPATRRSMMPSRRNAPNHSSGNTPAANH